ncbi:adenylate kinase [Chitinophaga sp. Mgbs1]|uniref:Adenylate kinase n=1 Tax=Chitinophaga solisilvae TaxID=1233460 RepID=A0A3S1B2I2_9BACT|nr:adenylate kinase [Chitinophaga solisilvae]
MKLHLFGASGTGVTTLGRVLAAEWQVPYFDSDDYFWEPSDPPFTVRRPADVRNARMQADIAAHPAWILGGSVINWGDQVFPVFDLIVFLWLPPEIRMQRLRERELDRYGTVIITDPVRKRLYEDFIAWAADYDQPTGLSGRTIHAHEAWISRQQAPVLQLRGDLSVTERMARIIAAIKNR